MKNVDEILNITGAFIIVSVSDISVTGFLRKKDNNVQLEFRIERENEVIIRDKYLQVYGCINGTHVTLIQSIINSTTFAEAAYCNMVIKPSFIVIGNEFPGKIFVTNKKANLSVLKRMFSEQPLKINYSFDENPAIVEY